MPQLINIKLTPKASSNRIGEMKEMPNGKQQLSLYVTAQPDKNKANEAMLKLLAKHFDVATSRLSIIAGHTSRNKLVQID